MHGQEVSLRKQKKKRRKIDHLREPIRKLDRISQNFFEDVFNPFSVYVS